MTNNEKRTAIAEACGWKFCPSKDNPLTGNAEPDVWVDSFGNKFWEDMSTHLPDYPNDLNAMHEAELTLNDGEAMEYERELRRVCTEQSYRHVISAKASQRAEAFLKTVGKWKED